jgi:putative glutamine amidotransferase
MIIGLTDPMKEGPTLGRYIDWIRGDGSDIEIRVLSYTQGSADGLAGCDALVLSGGNDVHPALYGRIDAWEKMKDVDEHRDKFEIGLVEAALSERLPILGICRGAQIFNVARGGSLVPDLQDAGYADHRSGLRGEKVHGITITQGSGLRTIVGLEAAEVNSSHHQAIDRPGEGLRITARSTDGVAEAAEWEQPEGKSFLMLVQWHPERITDGNSPVAAHIRNALLTHLRPTPNHQT